jgi:hypothetical protein
LLAAEVLQALSKINLLLIFQWIKFWFISVIPGRKSSGSSLENREYSGKDLSCWPRGSLCPQKLALTSPTSGGRSVGIVC